jgi:hypothetical protein
VLYDVKPQQTSGSIARSAEGKLPVEEHRPEERHIPAEGLHALQGYLQKNLTADEQHALHYCFDNQRI